MLMSEDPEGDARFADLPFHEYCAHCNQRFDEKILDPTVMIVETDEERALHSFCDEECLSKWANEK